MSERSTAQETQQASAPWYVGVRAGVPLGISTFSSFGVDKTRLGWGGGLYGGYHFNSIFSLEASAAISRMGLSAQACCIEKGYWLGTDGIRYNTPVAGMECYHYDDVMSRVVMQQYGLHGNVNLLGLFTATRESRWSVSLSPAVYLAGTKATLKTISIGTPIGKHDSDWHFGVGGDIQAQYHCTPNLSVGVYSGVTYLTGKRLDGAPEYRHKNNYVWESGIRIGWRFGAKRSKRKPVPTEIIPVEPCQTVPQPASSTEPKATAKAEIQAANPTADEKLAFPVIYFSFDKTSLRADQCAKLEQVEQMLTQHPNVKIEVTGWCDANGSDAVNRRYSLQRAESVKQWLVKKGIAPERIETKGGGVDHQAADNQQARRAQFEERRNQDE